MAKALGSDAFELERGGETLKLDVPDHVTLELEVEIDADETELELELKWSNKPEGDPEPVRVTRKPRKKATSR